MYLLAKFDVHGSYENVDINSYINFYMINSERAKRTARSPILRDFQNQEYRFTIPKTGRKSRGRRLRATAKRYDNAK